MITLPNTLTAFFDVDETLVTLTYFASDTLPGPDELVVDWYGKVKITPRQEYVDALKAHKMEGHNVVVWSGGGSEWAEKVVKKLKLEHYVDMVMPKPTVFYDDCRPEDFMSNKVFVDSTNVANPMEFVQEQLEDIKDE